jgi:hypothetical protein
MNEVRVHAMMGGQFGEFVFSMEVSLLRLFFMFAGQFSYNLFGWNPAVLFIASAGQLPFDCSSGVTVNLKVHRIIGHRRSSLGHLFVLFDRQE